MEDELVARNVADLVKPIFPAVMEEGDNPTDLAILTPEQVTIMEMAAVATPYYTLLYIEVRTGLRRSEILALRWMDVDIDSEASTLSVRRKLYYTKETGLDFGPPKSKKSRRTISISPKAAEALRDHRATMGDEYKTPESLIFHQGNGLPIFPDTVSSWFPAFLVDNGLPRLTFHALRHTHASLLLAATNNMKLVSERLGHSSIRITMDLYSHLLPTTQQEATSHLENLLKKAPGDKKEKGPRRKPRKP